MSPHRTLAVRLLLALMALSLAFVAARKGLQALRYLSPLVDLPGTVVTGDLIDPIPMAKDNPRARDIVGPVPTRLQVTLSEYPGLRFQVALREDPELIPPRLAPGEQVTLVLPARWREMEVGDRVLTMGLLRGTQVLVDPAGYPYASEYRTVFLAAGAAAGALIAALGAWRIRPEPPLRVGKARPKR